jgi:hypothetical protein
VSSVLDPPLIQPQTIQLLFTLASMYLMTGLLGLWVKTLEDRDWRSAYAADYDQIWLAGMKIKWH